MKGQLWPAPGACAPLTDDELRARDMND